LEIRFDFNFNQLQAATVLIIIIRDYGPAPLRHASVEINPFDLFLLAPVPIWSPTRHLGHG
jgi:hypothetical protein